MKSTMELPSGLLLALAGGVEIQAGEPENRYVSGATTSMETPLPVWVQPVSSVPNDDAARVVYFTTPGGLVLAATAYLKKTGRLSLNDAADHAVESVLARQMAQEEELPWEGEPEVL